MQYSISHFSAHRSSLAIAAVVGGLFASLLFSQPASAQASDSTRDSANVWAISLSAGFNNPSGRFGDTHNPGPAIDATVEMHPHALGPLGFWGDVNWNHFGGTATPSDSSEQHSTDFVQMDLGAIFEIPTLWHRPGVRPYVLGGLGAFHVFSAEFRSCTQQVCSGWFNEDSKALGFDALAGIGLGVPLSNSFEWISEARYDSHPGAPAPLTNAPFFQFQIGLRYEM